MYLHSLILASAMIGASMATGTDTICRDEPGYSHWASPYRDCGWIANYNKCDWSSYNQNIGDAYCPVSCERCPSGPVSHDKVSVDKGCYEYGEEIVASFANKHPLYDDWIGVYHVSVADDTYIIEEEPSLWLYLCGNQHDKCKASYGNLTFSREDPVVTGIDTFPLDAGTYLVYLLRDSWAPYTAYVVSDSFEIKATGETCSPTPAPHPYSDPTPEPHYPDPTPAPVHPTPAPVHPTPAPVHPTPAPHVYYDPDPTPAPVYPTPAPVHPTPAPHPDPYPTPTHPTPAPHPYYDPDPTPAPVHPTPAPVHPTPAPVHPTPAPVHPTPAPIYPDPTPAPVSCTDEYISTDKTCYLEGEPIEIKFEQCSPRKNDWIGLYFAGDGDVGDDLGGDFRMWVWSCGTQSCQVETFSNTIFFDENDPRESGSDSWPLQINPSEGYKVHLLRFNPDDFGSYLASDTFVVLGPYDSCEEPPHPTPVPHPEPTPAPAPHPTPCADSVTADDTCYAWDGDDEIKLTFTNCDPKKHNWLGIYDDHDDPHSLGAPLYWVWLCGSTDCYTAADSGTIVILSSILKRVGLHGEYRAHLIESANPTSMHYSAYASSETFSVEKKAERCHY